MTPTESGVCGHFDEAPWNTDGAWYAARTQFLNEVQMLADEKQFGPLVTALRSALDAHRDRIKAIFTGSSQDGLRLMFQKEKAPHCISSASNYRFRPWKGPLWSTC